MVAKTRWSSHYRVVALFLANRGSIEHALRDWWDEEKTVANQTNFNGATNIDADALFDFLLLTAPVAVVTSYAQGVSYVTSSSSIPLVGNIYRKVEALRERYLLSHDSDGAAADGVDIAGPWLAQDEFLRTYAGFRMAVELQAALAARFFSGEGPQSDNIEHSPLFAFPTLLDPAFNQYAWRDPAAYVRMVGELKGALKCRVDARASVSTSRTVVPATATSSGMAMFGGAARLAFAAPPPVALGRPTDSPNEYDTFLNLAQVSQAAAMGSTAALLQSVSESSKEATESSSGAFMRLPVGPLPTVPFHNRQPAHHEVLV